LAKNVVDHAVLGDNSPIGVDKGKLEQSGYPLANTGFASPRRTD